MKKLEPGDIVEFKQDDGKLIILIIHPSSIVIKANTIGTYLKIERDNSFLVRATAIDKQ